MSQFFITLTIFSIFSVELFAMAAQPTKVFLWKRGETIGAEDFIAANEEIVDYIATLRRPTDPWKGIKYSCNVKSRVIQPSVQNLGGGNNNQQYVTVRMVYELKDCVEAP